MSTSPLKPPAKLAGIRVGILSPDEIRKIAVVRINNPELESPEAGPVPGGPVDPRLGPPDPLSRCKHCGLPRALRDKPGCVGHFGYIELAVPVYHPGFVKMIEKVLNAICLNCFRLTLPKDKYEEYWKMMERFIEEHGFPSPELAAMILKEAVKTRECPHCGQKKTRKYRFNPTTMSFVEYKELSREELEQVKELIKRGELKPENIKTIRGKHYLIKPVKVEFVKKVLANLYPERALSKEELREHEKDLYLMGFHPKYARPEWMILEVLPVPPITVRPPIYSPEGKRHDHLTAILREIIRVNERLRSKLRSGPSPLTEKDITRLHRLIAALFGIERYSRGITIDNIPIKGIIMRLRGKEGRFRYNLSGKRVDFSGRAVISPDPYLRIDEVGVPIRMAMKLTVLEEVNESNIEKLRQLVINGPFTWPGATEIYQKTERGYTRKTLSLFKSRKEREKIAMELKPGDLVERHLMDGDPVVLNRHPSLHRLSMIGHYAKILPGNTLRLPLYVCPPYNADFDGDEMNIHIPRSIHTRFEVETIMNVRRQIITPRYGGPIIGPKQDYITGAYLLTHPDTYLTKEEATTLLFAAGIEKLPEPDKYDEKGRPLWSGRKIFSQIIPKYIFYEGKIDGILVGKPGQKVLVRIWNGEIQEGSVIDKNSIGAEKPENIISKIIERYGYDAAMKFLNSMNRMVLRYLTDRGFSITVWDVYVPRKLRQEIENIIDKYIKEAEELVKQYKEGKLEPEPGKTLKETFEDKMVEILERARSKTLEPILRSMPFQSQFLIMTVTKSRGDEVNIQQVLGCIGQPVVRGKRVQRGYSGRLLPHFRKGDIGPYGGGFVKNSFATGMNPIEFFFHAAGSRDNLVDTAIRTADSGYFYRRLVYALQDSKVEYDGTARDMYGYILQFKYGGDGIHPGKSYHGKLTDYESLFYELIVRREEKGIKVNIPAKWPSYYDDAIEVLRREISVKVAMDVKELFEKMLEKGYVLTKEETDEYVQRLLRKYIRAQIDPNEASGTVAAQSICEPATQLVLRTFHWAGVAAFSITSGLPRLKEIFDAVSTPKTPIIDIYLTDEYRWDENKAQLFRKRITPIRITNIVEPDGFFLSATRRRVVIKLDREKLKTYNLTVNSIVEKIAKIRNISIERPDEFTIEVIPKENVPLTEVYKKIQKIIFSGIEKLGRSQVVKTKYDENKYEYRIIVEGSDLSPLVYLDGVDMTRTIPNNIHTIAKILGIEAARFYIALEAKRTLDMYGLDVDMRHILYAADAVTRNGIIEAIGRYGISGKKLSFLARAAFEETGKQIFLGAKAGMYDALKGATENTIAGQVIPLGTGAVRIGSMIIEEKE